LQYLFPFTAFGGGGFFETARGFAPPSTDQRPADKERQLSGFSLNFTGAFCVLLFLAFVLFLSQPQDLLSSRSPE